MNNLYYRTVFAALALSLGFGLSAHAQSQGGAISSNGSGVIVNGDVKIDAEAGTVTTVGIGQDVITESNVGTIGGNNTIINGDADIKAKVDTVTTVGIGQRVKSCSNVGMVGSSACQQ